MQEIKQILLNEAEDGYQRFSAKLIPNVNNVLGVRLPKLRKIAKEIYRTKDWQTFLQQDTEFLEETMLQGIVIGLVDQDIESLLNLVKNFVPKIDNWAVCDSFCAGLKYANKYKEEVWTFLQSYLGSEKEYDKRFAFVMLLNYFVDEKFLDKVFEIFDCFKDERYYAKMAVAWALSIYYIKFPEETLHYLKISKLDDWTFNKSIQKICESLRVDKITKESLRKLTRPKK